ncbi:hypothetical protein FTO74_08510 [Granulicella sp. WH15]|uniref:PD40 domain-containing protein n=1 Tax=Granulicella sp. WH15 TaxID=2602070 RepID=UPI0013674346|nr:PD40 domain-containing protein [Granulicella sp. WH15]QHN03399.1 hypothetical protein FTO74_08510 [Granulicella sp. WH15]
MLLTEGKPSKNVSRGIDVVRSGKTMGQTQVDERKQQEDVEQALQRICISAEFAKAGRAKDILLFIVRHSFAKPGIGLSEREIAAEVLDSPDDWDPKVDPSIRITVGRLRTKLDRYYAVSGDSDPVRIELPKGSYVPRLVFQEHRISPRSAEIEPPILDHEDTAAKGRSPRAIAFLTVALLLTVSLLAFFYFRHSNLPFEQRAYSISALTSAPGRESSPAVSPDGHAIAFVWDANGKNYDIYITNADGTGLRRLTNSPDPEFSPAWSPDGERIAFIRVKDYLASIVVKPVRGGGAEKVVKTFRAAAGSWVSDLDPVFDDIGPIWSPDGRHLVYSDLTDQHALVEVEIETDKIQRLTPPYDLTKDLRDFYPRYSGDGRYIAYAHYTSHGSGDLYLLDRTTGNTRQLTHDQSAIRGLSWLPDHKSLVFASDREGSSILWTMNAFSDVVPRLLPADSAHVLEPASGPSRDWLVYVDSTENWALRRYEVTPSGLRKDTWILPTNARNHEPVYSRDGKHIAFTSDRSGHWAVWMADADGTNLIQLTSFEGHWMGGVSWSSDGTKLIFDARPKGHSNLFMVQASDHKLVHLIDSPYEDRVPTWSKDGSSIYFSSTRNGSLALYKFDAQSQDVSLLFPNIFAAEASPDEDLIFGGDNVGNFNVFTSSWVPLPALTQHIRPDPVLNWSVSQGGLYFTTRETPESPYEVVRYAHGVFTRLGNLDGAVLSGRNITVSPDGRYIVVAEAVSTKSNLKIRKLLAK